MEQKLDKIKQLLLKEYSNTKGESIFTLFNQDKNININIDYENKNKQLKRKLIMLNIVHFITIIGTGILAGKTLGLFSEIGNQNRTEQSSSTIFIILLLSIAISSIIERAKQKIKMKIIFLRLLDELEK